MRRAVLVCLLAACQPPPAPCAQDPQRAEVAAPLNVTLYSALDVPAADLSRLNTALQDWARCANVNLHVQERPPQVVARPFPLTTAQLEKLPPDEAACVLTEPLVGLVRQLALPGSHVVVALLPELAPPSSAAAAVLPELVGLGLPATLTAAAEIPPWMLALPSPRAPFVLVSALRLRALTTAAERASAVGHELGHALGLVHDARRCNLMATTASCGVGWLDAVQAARLRPQR